LTAVNDFLRHSGPGDPRVSSVPRFTCATKPGENTMSVIAQRTALACAALLLNACATMSADECRTANWYEVGVRDGQAGRAAERLQEHREACAEVKVVPDEARYAQGRSVGLRTYCTPENAVHAGLAGETYEGVCGGGVAVVFARNYQAAYAVYTAKRVITGLDSEVSGKEREIRDDKTTDKRRGELRSEIREIDRKRERARDDLRGAELNLDRVVSGR
jgi:hypothetical protein